MSDDAIFFWNPRVLFQVVDISAPDADQVANNLKVSQFDYGATTENTLNALNQVQQRHSASEEMESSQTKIFLYTMNFRKDFKAKECRIQHQREKWHCGHIDQSTIDHSIAGITGNLVISPEQCPSLANGKMMYLVDHFFGVDYDAKNPIVITDCSTSDNIRSYCKSRRWITLDTFLPHLQRMTPKVKMSTGKL